MHQSQPITKRGDMRWFWIDRFLEFQSGDSATAVKNISLSEDHLHEHFNHYPVMPNSLVIEGLAQTGGLLVGEQNGFDHRVVLAKVSKSKFYIPAVPGDTLTYRVKLLDIRRDGALIDGTSHIGDKLQAEVKLFFAHVGDSVIPARLFNDADFLSMLRLLKIYDVGIGADGQPLKAPPILLEAEARLVGNV